MNRINAIHRKQIMYPEYKTLENIVLYLSVHNAKNQGYVFIFIYLYLYIYIYTHTYKQTREKRHVFRYSDYIRDPIQTLYKSKVRVLWEACNLQVMTTRVTHDLHFDLNDLRARTRPALMYGSTDGLAILFHVV